MIRLSDKDAAVVASLAQYQQLPLERKHALVNRLSEQAKPIGMILIGESPENPSEACVKLANKYHEWTARNTRERSSVRTATRNSPQTT